MVTKSQNFLGISGFRRNSEEFCGEKFLGISSEFSNMSLKTVIPTKIYHLGDQFWGIFREFPRNQLQERILEKFLGNSSKKVTTVGESGEITHFCYLETYKKCAYDLQKVYIEPKKVYIRPKTIKVYISDLKKDKKGLPSKSTFSMQHMLELYQACIGRIKENKCATDQQLL